jgi:hypothetical protein
MTLAFVLMLVALILLLLAAFNVPSSRVGLFPLGMAFFVGAFLLGAYPL